MLDIKTDSRKIKPGDTFVAIKGFTVDGHDYIEKAIHNGAKKIICEHGSYSVETVIVENTKIWLQNFLVKHYKNKINELTLIGVTGTNGKTTTCFLTYQMLLKLGVKAAYIGTIGFYMGDVYRELSNTTPEIVDLYSMLLEALDAGCTHVVMEVSSHSLCEKRIEGLEFSVEVFTNLTEDHLDFHKTMEHYLEAKLLLLNQLKNDGVIITNVDDLYGKYFKKNSYKTLGYHGYDYKIIKYENTSLGTKIHFQRVGVSYEVDTNLRSSFNVYNYLSSFAILDCLHFPVSSILAVTKEVYPPKGRCEQIKVFDGEAVIDYAHTPDAVEKIISAFHEKKKGKIYTIIGCGGDRDPIKRPIMGDIATKLSDYVIFTSDNPRTEDPNKILKDITNGLERSNYEVEIDRRKSIEKGLSMIHKDDILLILGKGHEDYQIIGKEKIHFDDKEEVEKFIKKENKL